MLSPALEGRPTAVRALFAHGASFEELDAYGNTPLCAVALRRDQTQEEALVILKLLCELGAPVDGPNARGETPLMCACERASPLCVQALLDAGANPNARSEDGRSPLMATIEKLSPRMGSRNVDIVAMLLAAGADPEAPDPHGQTALSFAKAMTASYPDNQELGALVAWGDARDIQKIISGPTPSSGPRPGLQARLQSAWKRPPRAAGLEIEISSQGVRMVHAECLHALGEALLESVNFV